MDPHAFELQYERTGHCGFNCGPLFVTVHKGLPEAEDFESMLAMTGRLVERYDSLVSLVVLRGEVPLSVDPSRRAAAERLGKAYPGLSKGTALVLEAEGVRASIYRSLLSGVMLISRSKTKTSVFRSVPEAIRWLAEIDSRLAGHVDELGAGYQTFLGPRGLA